MKRIAYIIFVVMISNLILNAIPSCIMKVNNNFKSTAIIKDTNNDIYNQLLFIEDKYSTGKNIEQIDKNTILLVTESRIQLDKHENYNIITNQFGSWKIENSYKISLPSIYQNYSNKKIKIFLKSSWYLPNGVNKELFINKQNEIDSVSDFKLDSIDVFDTAGVFLEYNSKNQNTYFTYKNLMINNKLKNIRMLKLADSNMKFEKEIPIDTFEVENSYKHFCFNFKNSYVVLSKVDYYGTFEQYSKLTFLQIDKQNYKIINKKEVKIYGLLYDVLQSNDNLAIFYSNSMYASDDIGVNMQIIDVNTLEILTTNEIKIEYPVSFRKVKKRSDNLFIAVGNIKLTKSYGVDIDFYVVCFDQNGKIIWERIWGADNAFDVITDFYIQDNNLSMTGYLRENNVYYAYLANLDLNILSVEDKLKNIDNLTQSTHIELYDILGRSIATFQGYEKLKAEIENYPPPHLIKWRDEIGIFHFEKMK